MERLMQQGVYLDDPREAFADFIPGSAARVLDVGCGKGGFGRTLRERLGHRSWVVGIESVEAQADVARQQHGFDEVRTGFFPEAVPDSWGGLDLICFMDVLEHMYDPWAALAACHDLLAEDGRVLASIPNIQYFPVLFNAAHGRWDYQDTGILDRTHVRFFTRRSIIEMFYRAGFEVERIEGVGDALDEFRYRWLKPAGSVLGDSRYLHLAVVARRAQHPDVPVSILTPRELPAATADAIVALSRTSSAEQRRRDSPFTSIRTRGRHMASIEAKFRLGIPTDLTCDYGTWKRRVEASRGADRDSDDRLGAAALPLAVVLHVYYADLLPRMVERLRVIPVPFDLIITNATGNPLSLPDSAARRVTVLDVENRGRDVWPFIQAVQSGLLDGYDAVMKLHTKKSPQGVAATLGANTGSEWREQLVGSMLDSEELFQSAYEAVTTGSGGLACHQGSIAGPEAWGTDRRAVRHLARRIGARCPAAKLRFPAGSIYMMRGALVSTLKDLRMSADDFEEETAGSYTTTAHAVERLMGYVASSQGLKVVGLTGPGL